MHRSRIPLGLLAALVLLATSATPAFAEFQAKGQWKVPVKVLKSGEFTDEGATFKCPENGIEATASLQSKGQIKIHQKEGKQEQVKRGPHLNINILKWGANCKVVIGSNTLNIVITPCELQFQQKPGQLTGVLGGVVTPCTITAGPCKIFVPAGQEKAAESGEGINVGLKEINFNNTGEILFAKVNTRGITVEVAKGTLCSLKTNSLAELVGIEMEIKGINVV